MKVIVIGKEGYIAQKLVCELEDKNIEYLLTSINPGDSDSIHLDLLKPDEFNYELIEENDVVLFLAAISSPEICENNYEDAYSVNVLGTSYFIDIALARKSKVLFFSSDVVYGFNESIIYDENSLCNPAGKYGEMKHEIEKIFMNNENFSVFRLSYIFSKNDKFSKYLHHCLMGNETAEIFHPFIRNAIYIEDLIEAVLNYITNDRNFKKYKVVNICGVDSLSRLDITELFIKNIAGSLKYQIIEPDSSFFLIRPRNIRTVSLFFKEIIGRDPITLEQAIIKEFIK